MRAACLARLAAAAIRIGLSYLGSRARASGTSGSTLCAVLRSWLRASGRPPASRRRTASARGPRCRSSSLESRSVSSPSNTGSLPILASCWIRLASSKASRQLAVGERSWRTYSIASRSPPASLPNKSQTMITTTTTTAGITKSCTTNPADGGSTGGRSGKVAGLSSVAAGFANGSLGWIMHGRRARRRRIGLSSQS